MKKAESITDPKEIRLIKQAFQNLMGINGDPFVQEIIETGMLSPRSYKLITENVYYNGEESVKAHFGLVYWYEMQYRRNLAV